MKEITSKEKILTAIRNSAVSKADFPMWPLEGDKEVFKPLDTPIELHFAKTFSELGGKFVFCQHLDDLAVQLNHIITKEQWDTFYCTTPELQKLLERFDIAFLSDEEDFHDAGCQLTSCEFLVARFGSVMMSSALPSGRRGHAWPEIHVVIAYASQMKAELKDALDALHEKYEGNIPTAVSLVSGPSRTADIEKTLVMGAHGPRELFLFYVDKQ